MGESARHQFSRGEEMMGSNNQSDDVTRDNIQTEAQIGID